MVLNLVHYVPKAADRARPAKREFEYIYHIPQRNIHFTLETLLFVDLGHSSEISKIIAKI